ncbi:MAG: DUF177 domain-containing protein [Dehalococcoidia bacterium]|nr:DUF177 domain-containing protein [Dehalococcoidia bacterium]
MEINVAQLLKETQGATRTYEVDDTLYLEEIAECHIQGQVQLVHTKRGILARGTFLGTGKLTCSRCLTSFEYPLRLNVEDEFLPSVDVSTGIAFPVDEDSNVFTIDDRHILDLSEALRQYSLVAMPMKPLCQPDCAGLCPECGSNLNQGACDCVPRSGGLPLIELEKLDSRRKSR